MADVPLTLADMADPAVTSDIAAGIAQRFREQSLLLDSLQYINVPSGTLKWNEELELPDVYWSAGNDGDPDASKGTFGPRSVSTKMLRAKLKVDNRAQKRGMANNSAALPAQFEAFSKALKYKAELAFFDGDSSGDKKEPDGMNVNLTTTSGADKNLIWMGSNGGKLTVTAIEDLIDSVDGGANALLMSKPMSREIQSMFRESGRITYNEPSSYVQPVAAFDGIPFIIIGKGAARTEILGFDETRGTSSISGSIYAVRFGVDGLFAIQEDPMSMEGPINEDVFTASYGYEWTIGYAMYTRTCAVRLGGVLSQR